MLEPTKPDKILDAILRHLRADAHSQVLEDFAAFLYIYPSGQCHQNASAELVIAERQLPDCYHAEFIMAEEDIATGREGEVHESTIHLSLDIEYAVN